MSQIGEFSGDLSISDRSVSIANSHTSHIERGQALKAPAVQGDKGACVVRVGYLLLTKIR